MENFWSTMLWIMAAFSLVFGVALMPLSVYGGAVSLLGAVLMAPPVSNALGRLVGKPWAPPIVGFLIATLAGPIVTFATALSLEEVLDRSAQRQADREARMERRGSLDATPETKVFPASAEPVFATQGSCYDSGHPGSRAFIIAPFHTDSCFISSLTFLPSLNGSATS